jgi:hypothetical protein
MYQNAMLKSHESFHLGASLKFPVGVSLDQFVKELKARADDWTIKQSDDAQLVTASLQNGTRLQIDSNLANLVIMASIAKREAGITCEMDFNYTIQGGEKI